MRRRFDGMIAGLAAKACSSLAIAIVVAFCGAAHASDPASAGPGDAASPAAPADADQSTNRLLCVHNLSPGESLPVRSGPEAQRPITGHFPANGCGINLAGSCRGDWCEMALGDVRGWVEIRFIGVYELPPPEPSP